MTQVATTSNNFAAPIRHNLTQQEIEVTKSLEPMHRAFVELRQEKPVSQLSQHEIKGYCHQVITKAFFDFSGGQTNDDIIVFQVQALMAELTDKKFQSITISELNEAFRLGIRGEFGEFFGLCSRTYHQFIKSFLSKRERAESWSRYLEALESLKRESMTPEHVKIERSKQALKNLFQKYRESGDLGMTPWAYYGALCDLIGTRVVYRTKDGSEAFYKTLFTDPVLRQKLDAQGEKEYKDSIAGKSNPDDIYSRSRKKDESEMEMARIITSALSKEDGLVNKKKEVALRYYFDQLIQDGMELEW